MDFTLKTYHQLLDALIAQGHAFQTFAGFLEKPEERVIMLRHDVEARYENALAFARMQHEQNIRGTYYFRFLPNHFSTEIIREIAALGHEIGYHYDDLSYCRGDYEKAIKRFEKNLATLREIAPVKTICMEGAPLSKWDNRTLWAKHQIPNSKFQTNSELKTHYSAYGIIGEPYFDLDFSKVFYLTDTGRRWDGVGSIRDKVISRQSSVKTRNPEPGTRNPELNFRHTRNIIYAALSGLLPDQIMLTFHPQRWTDRPGPWLQELVMQNVKNVVKRWMVWRRA